MSPDIKAGRPQPRQRISPSEQLAREFGLPKGSGLDIQDAILDVMPLKYWTSVVQERVAKEDLENHLTSEERLIGVCLGVYPDPRRVMQRTPEDITALQAKEDAARAARKPLTEEVDKIWEKHSITGVEKRVLMLRFGLDDGTQRTQAQAGQEIGGLSRWQVGRIERRALTKLRQHPK